MNPDAPPFIPSFARVPHSQSPSLLCYNRATLKEIELSVVESIRCAPLTDVQFPVRLPIDFALLLKIPHALELLNLTHVVSLVQSVQVPTTSSSSSSYLFSSKNDEKLVPSCTGSCEKNKITQLNTKLHPHCTKCENGPEACSTIRELISSTVRHAASSRLGAAMLQSGDVVWGLLQLALVFEARQSSLRLRTLAERHPQVVDRVREYLCGEGYHLPLPSVTAHEEWQVLNSMLRFDWIRDNRTRIFTEISKRWKKRHTQFEQFVHFFEFRDDRPIHPVKNMLTHSVKPIMVSILSGDIIAVVLLARLGFFVPPDYYWDIFPFFSETLLTKDSDGNIYNIMRHLCLHLTERQYALRRDVFNPISKPRRS